MLERHDTAVAASRGLAAFLDRAPRPAGVDALAPGDLEELIRAIDDRADAATADVAARLARGRVALELELGRRLEA